MATRCGRHIKAVVARLDVAFHAKGFPSYSSTTIPSLAAV